MASIKRRIVRGISKCFNFKLENCKLNFKTKVNILCISDNMSAVLIRHQNPTTVTSLGKIYVNNVWHWARLNDKTDNVNNPAFGNVNDIVIHQNIQSITPVKANFLNFVNINYSLGFATTYQWSHAFATCAKNNGFDLLQQIEISVLQMLGPFGFNQFLLEILIIMLQFLIQNVWHAGASGFIGLPLLEFWCFNWPVFGDLAYACILSFVKKTPITQELFEQQQNQILLLKNFWTVGNIVLRNIGIFNVKTVIENPYDNIALACDMLRSASASQNHFGYAQFYFNFLQGWNNEKTKTNMVKTISNSKNIRAIYEQIIDMIVNNKTNWNRFGDLKNDTVLQSLSDWPAEAHKTQIMSCVKNFTYDAAQAESYIKQSILFKNCSTVAQAKILHCIRQDIHNNSLILLLTLNIPQWVNNAKYANCWSMPGLERLFIILLNEKEKIMYSILIATIGLKYGINIEKCLVFMFMGLSYSKSFVMAEYLFGIDKQFKFEGINVHKLAILHELTIVLMYSNRKRTATTPDWHRVFVPVYKNYIYYLKYRLVNFVCSWWTVVEKLYSQDGPYNECIQTNNCMNFSDIIGYCFQSKVKYHNFKIQFDNWKNNNQDNPAVNYQMHDDELNPLFKCSKFAASQNDLQNDLQSKKCSKFAASTNEEKTDELKLQELLKQIQRNKTFVEHKENENESKESGIIDEFDGNFSVYHGDDWETSTIASDVTSMTVFSIASVNYSNNSAIKPKIKQPTPIHTLTHVGKSITTTIYESKEVDSNKQEIVLPTMDMTHLHKHLVEEYCTLDELQQSFLQQPQYSTNAMFLQQNKAIFYFYQATDCPKGEFKDNRNITKLQTVKCSLTSSNTYHGGLGIFNSHKQYLTLWTNIKHPWIVIEDGTIKKRDLNLINLMIETKSDCVDYTYYTLPELPVQPWLYRNELINESVWLKNISIKECNEYLMKNHNTVQECQNIQRNQSVITRKIACQMKFIDWRLVCTICFV